MPLLLIWKFLSTYNLLLIEQTPTSCLYSKIYLELGVLQSFYSVSWLKTPGSQGVGPDTSVETMGSSDANWYYFHCGRHEVYHGKAAGGGKTVRCCCLSGINKCT